MPSFPNTTSLLVAFFCFNRHIKECQGSFQSLFINKHFNIILVHVFPQMLKSDAKKSRADWPGFAVLTVIPF